ncbi:1,6-anhydro-N-acetylmuramyl-L-alanine amidase AmpD [uncultured Psychrobacter sp.]|uniref:1,6-anhydro-N-acetylmuramyl-L-alanine amidase AmpD n=1 Tax=uncultured Psychrobacter sp. TaxID=259303 RepID=UPI003457D8A0
MLSSSTNSLQSSSSTSTQSMMTISEGRLLEAAWLPSPNYNNRPTSSAAANTINTIVIHNISLPPDEFGAQGANGLHYVKALFLNQLDWNAHPYFQTIEGAQVSAHLFIERDGNITQFVNFADRAWHAGRSSYLGRPECNDYSIGIELEGSDFVDFEEAQYQVLTQVIIAIYHAYPKTRRHLTGHSDIAPNRKTDPGDCFDWAKLRRLVAGQLSE